MREVELSIGGMTCASCAARVERKLNKPDGVRAEVNFATEKGQGQLPRTARGGRPGQGDRGRSA